jgi:branched-chain amino acid transport system permease protein
VAVWRDGWDLFFQRVVDALNNGFIYAAMALSLVLIYKATGVINFAQGNMAMFGTFIAWVFISDHGFPVWLGVAVAMLLSAAGGAAIERIFIRPFDPSNHLALTIVTLAWFIILGALATVIWGADPYAFDTPFPAAATSTGGARFFYENLGVWVCAGVLLLVSPAAQPVGLLSVPPNRASWSASTSSHDPFQMGLAAAVGGPAAHRPHLPTPASWGPC